MVIVLNVSRILRQQVLGRGNRVRAVHSESGDVRLDTHHCNCRVIRKLHLGRTRDQLHTVVIGKLLIGQYELGYVRVCVIYV